MAQSDADESFEVGLARTRALEPDFIGQTKAEAELLAESLSLELRVIETDDTAVTADLRSNRMTVDVRSGSVTSATAG